MKQFLMVLCVIALIFVCTYVLIGTLPTFALNGLLDLGQFLETLDPSVL